MEINEEIAKEYFTKVERCFIIENVLYQVEAIRNDGNKVKSWSDIDLLAYNPKKNEIIDIEVKYRHGTVFHKGADKTSSIYRVVDSFKKKERIKKIKEYNPDKLKVKRIFITNKRAFTDKSRDEFEKLLFDDNIDILYFEKIVSALNKHYQEHSNKMTSVIGQMFRLLNPKEVNL